MLVQLQQGKRLAACMIDCGRSVRVAPLLFAAIFFGVNFAPNAHAHPHGAASCEVQIERAAGRVTGATVALELDDQRSREVLTSMQAAPDGTASPQQEARMAFNLHLLFARLNYLTTVAVAKPGGDTEIALSATRPPQLLRQPGGRIKVVAALVRPLNAVETATPAEPEEQLRITCADPSWYWLVGFLDASAVRSADCKPVLGPGYTFALPAGMPKTDAPSIEVTASNTPRSQTVELRCGR